MQRIRIAAAFALLATLTLIPQVLASHGTGASKTVSIPGTVVPFLCLTLGDDPPEETCTPTSVQGGTLTLTITGPAAHGVGFGVDNQPAECANQTPPRKGVAIFVQRGTVGPGTATATVEGTGAFEGVDESITQTLAEDPGGKSKAARATACDIGV